MRQVIFCTTLQVYPADMSEWTGMALHMPFQRTVLAVILFLLPATALSTSHAQDLQVADEGEDASVTSELPEPIRNLPPTAAGPNSAPEIPLHFVPPNVQAFQELGTPAEGDGKSPAENMLPFRF